VQHDLTLGVIPVHGGMINQEETQNINLMVPVVNSAHPVRPATLHMQEGRN